MQPNEAEGEIFVLVVDETYGGNEETYEEDSESYRQGLESEFNAQFAPTNVGAGADIPAFLTIIATTSVPLWVLVLSMFFLGKPVKENLDAWKEIGAGIQRFFDRPIILSRHGAAVLAVEAVFDKMGGTPKAVRLLSYRPHHAYEDDWKSLATSRDTEPAPPVLNLGHVLHVFEIEADGVAFRVAVDGKVAQAIPL